MVSHSMHNVMWYCSNVVVHICISFINISYMVGSRLIRSNITQNALENSKINNTYTKKSYKAWASNKMYITSSYKKIHHIIRRTKRTPR